MSDHVAPIAVPEPPQVAATVVPTTERAPAVVRSVLREAGEPLDPPVRTAMQRRFGHDFSRVRVHAGETAARAAGAIDAAAWTLGSQIVFGRGRYRPRTREGQALLAHELGHVVQQPVVARGGELRIGARDDVHESIADWVARGGRAMAVAGSMEPVIRRRSLLDGIAGLFAGDDFPIPELDAYLAVLDQGQIEGYNESDNKARAIVKLQMAGQHDFGLTPDRQVLLIKEMQDGSCGDDDENAILSLLTAANNEDLSLMFAAGKLDAKSLLSDLDGEENDRLVALLDARFEGGVKNVEQGLAVPKPREQAFGKEVFEIQTAEDARQVRAIIQDIHDRYGVDLDSQAGVDAIKARYGDNTDVAELNGLKTRVWHLSELKALQRALLHYAPILGASRAGSTRAKDPQELGTVAKDEQSISRDPTDHGKGKRDTTTIGEYYGDSRLFGFYGAIEGDDHNFPGSPDKQLEGTATHEIGHGVLAYRLPDFIKKFKYWKSETVRDAVPDTATSQTRVANKNVEAPITQYGTTNADEDLSETAKFYFVEPDTLKNGQGTPKKPRGTPGNPCPERHAFMEDTVKKWTPPPPKPAPAPKGKTK